MKQWCWKKFRCRQVKLSKSCALQARLQSGHANSAPRSATTSRCSSCGRVSTSKRCPASFHGSFKPSPRENTSFGSIPPPPCCNRASMQRPAAAFNRQPIPLGASRSLQYEERTVSAELHRVRGKLLAARGTSPAEEV